MFKLQRSAENPVLKPTDNEWEKVAAFNGSVIKDGDTFHMLYRAVSEEKEQHGEKLQVSTIGHAISSDGIHFIDHQQFIKPEEEFEKFGCEDPRVTKFGDYFYVFYTALSTFPFSASGIKSAVVKTKDFKTIEKKALVTPYNSKAMTLFPEKINGKMTAILPNVHQYGVHLC